MKCQMDLLTWYCRGLGASGQQRFGIPAAPPADGWGPSTPRLRYYMSFGYLSSSFDHLSTSFNCLSHQCWYSHLADHIIAEAFSL